MKWRHILLLPLVLAVTAPPTSAGFFSRKPKSNPAERVPELLIQLKTGKDEGHRLAAAEELRQYDAKAYPEVVTSLIDALGRDTSAAVRAEAASSLGKLRPISQSAGYALEQAQNNDGAVRVRLAARQALLQYHLVGYRSGKSADVPATTAPAEMTISTPPGPSTPAARTGPFGALLTRNQATDTTHSPARMARESAEPPLADSVTTPAKPAARPPAGAPPRFVPPNPGLQPMPQPPDAPKPAAPTNGPVLPPS
jgi:hypothetical protein